MIYSACVFCTLLVSILNYLSPVVAQKRGMLSDLNESLKGFETCNICVIAEFGKTKWEPLSVPVMLFDVKNLSSSIHNLWPDYQAMKKSTLGRGFKYRDSVCTLELLLDDVRPDYVHFIRAKQRFIEFMEDKYWVIVQSHANFIAETAQSAEIWRLIVTTLIDHKVYVWTVLQKYNVLGMLQLNQFVIHDIFYIYGISSRRGSKQNVDAKHDRLEVQQTPHLRSQMDIFSLRLNYKSVLPPNWLCTLMDIPCSLWKLSTSIIHIRTICALAHWKG